MTTPSRKLRPTLGFQRVLQRAVYHVQSSGKKEVTGVNVLVAIFGEKQTHAVYLLGLQNVSRLDVVNFISHGVSKLGTILRRIRASQQPERDVDSDSGGSALAQFATNLNEKARQGKIDPLIGRAAEVAENYPGALPATQK